MLFLHSFSFSLLSVGSIGVSRNFQRYAITVLIFCPLIYSFPYISSDFWVDEITTYWVIAGSFEEVFTRTQEFQGQSSLYYIIEWCVLQLCGFNETLLRLPSTVAALLCLPCCFKIARHWLDRNDALLCSALYAVNEQFVFYALTARSYSFAVLCFLLATLCLLDWLKDARNSKLVLFVIFAAATLYFNYLFLGTVLFYCTLLLLKHLKDPRRFHYRFFWAMLGLAALMLPCVKHLRILASKSGIYQFASAPTLFDYVSVLLWPEIGLILLTLAVIVEIARVLGKKRSVWRFYAPKSSLWPCIALWLLIPPSILVLSYLLTGASNFYIRYIIWMKPATSLLAAAVAAGFLQPAARKGYLVLLLLLSLAVNNYPHRPLENWRELFSQVKALESQTAVVLFAGGLVEAQSTEWLQNQKKRQYLRAPLSLYGAEIKSPTELTPVNVITDKQKAYVRNLLKSYASKNGDILLAMRNFQDTQEQHGKLLSEAGFKQVSLSRFKGTRLIRYQRKSETVRDAKAKRLSPF